MPRQQFLPTTLGYMNHVGFTCHSMVQELCGVCLPLYGIGTMWGLPATLYMNYVGFACHSMVQELCGVRVSADGVRIVNGSHEFLIEVWATTFAVRALSLIHI